MAEGVGAVGDFADGEQLGPVAPPEPYFVGILAEQLAEGLGVGIGSPLVGQYKDGLSRAVVLAVPCVWLPVLGLLQMRQDSLLEPVHREEH